MAESQSRHNQGHEASAKISGNDEARKHLFEALNAMSSLMSLCARFATTTKDPKRPDNADKGGVSPEIWKELTDHLHQAMTGPLGTYYSTEESLRETVDVSVDRDNLEGLEADDLFKVALQVLDLSEDIPPLKDAITSFQTAAASAGEGGASEPIMVARCVLLNRIFSTNISESEDDPVYVDRPVTQVLYVALESSSTAETEENPESLNLKIQMLIITGKLNVKLYSQTKAKLDTFADNIRTKMLEQDFKDIPEIERLLIRK